VDGSGAQQAFVVDETDGNWGTVGEVPGTATLNQGGYAAITSVSCVSAGNCGAGGYYEDSSGYSQAFVVSKTGGTWGTADAVTPTAALPASPLPGIDSLSCAAVGNCRAGGDYAGNSGKWQALLVSEAKGTWAAGKVVAGTKSLNKGGGADVTSVSCSSAGNCSAGGYYTNTAGDEQAFVVTQTKGTWSSAEEVPGTGSLNTMGEAEISSVSCRGTGNCSAGGYYYGSGGQHAFVVDETDGTWGTAEEVLDAAAVTSVSCASAGNCSAGGSYWDGSGDQQAFVVDETDGTWGTAQEVPGTGTLNEGGYAAVTSISCPSAGNCTAGGYYQDGSGYNQAFVVDETDGTWGTAEEAPGTADLNQDGDARVTSLSCGSAGDCSAGGYYKDSSGDYQAFVDSEADGT
jgi:D-alanine-D-alanine ligase-like ATP-grasp enzyme